MSETIHRSRKVFEPGTIYRNPFRPPGTAPRGFTWAPEERHRMEGYPLSWKLVATESVSSPPPNFPPPDRMVTYDEENPPILTFAQGVSQALDRKHDEGKQ